MLSVARALTKRCGDNADEEALPHHTIRHCLEAIRAIASRDTKPEDHWYHFNVLRCFLPEAQTHMTHATGYNDLLSMCLHECVAKRGADDFDEHARAIIHEVDDLLGNYPTFKKRAPETLNMHAVRSLQAVAA